MQDVKVQVRFEIGGYTDCLYYSLDEWSSITDEQLEANKQARYDKWVEAKENPPVEEGVLVEEVVASIDEQIEALQAQKEELLTSKEA